MFQVVKKGKQFSAELVSTAYRGSCVYIRYLTTQGNIGVSIPHDTAQAAKSCYVVDWVPASGIEYSDSATGADRLTSTPSQVVCHYDGIYKSNLFVTGYASVFKYRGATAAAIMATPEATHYADSGNEYNPYPHLWVICSSHASYPGYLTDTTNPVYTAFNDSKARIVSDGGRMRANANFWLKSIDNASADSGADSVQQTLWVEFESIPYRIGKGWTATAAVDAF